MACRTIQLPDGGTAIGCGRGATPTRCQVAGCRRHAEALCDHQLEAYEAGRTCSMRLCALHRTKTGPGTDLCPYHARVAAASSSAPDERE